MNSFKWARGATAFIIGIPLLGVAIWYLISFLPHVREIKEIAVRGNAEAGGVENLLYPLAVAAESEDRIRSWSVSRAYSYLVNENARDGMLSWHANNLLWIQASRLHLSDRQVFGLWVACAISGCGHGLEGAAKTYFGRPLKDLSEPELAALVAAVSSPSRFSPGSEAGMKRAHEILERSKSRSVVFGSAPRQ